MCGEYVRQHISSFGTPGSSPRVRGICVPGVVAMVNLRIIPACAGNIIYDVEIVLSDEDHPRVCGGYANMPVAVKPEEGSSPRVRGIS